MIKITSIHLLLFGLILSSCTQVSEIQKADITFEKLYCDYQENPLGIDNLAPRLTWIAKSAKSTGHQSAYQILVSTALESINKNDGDIWDSGKVRSDQSAQVPYAGPSLKSRVRYFWKVRIWDENDHVSEYSQPNSWSMGLLLPVAWQSKWISAPKLFDWSARDMARKQLGKNAPPEREEPAPIFRKAFTLTGNIKSAHAYVSGLGYYELYLNGKKIGKNMLDPAFTAYDKTVLYTTYDITDLLKDDANALGVMLGNGWYNMFSRGVWSFDKSVWRNDPTVRIQLRILYNNGKVESIISDEDWKSFPGPVVFNSIRQGEEFDARLEPEGWSKPGFDDSQWFPVRLVQGPQGIMTAQSLPPIQEMQYVEPVKIYKTKRGTWVCDFGQNMAGYVQLQIDTEEGKRIQFKYGEKLNRDGTVDQSNIDGLVADSPFQTDIYTTKGGGVEIWHPRFTYHGFQYVEIDGFPGIPNKENIKACLVSTSFEKKGTFECSSELLNQIQHNAEWSFLSNFHGYPTDCPHREKNGWTGDAQLAADMALYNFHVESAFDKWVNDIVDSQLPSGMVSAIVPTGGWGYYWGNGPAWDYAMIILPWNMYLHSGDRQVLEKYYPAMRKYMSFLTSTAENYIVRWGLGDWVPLKTQTPAELITTAYFYHDAVLLAKMAEILGQQDDVLEYRELAQNIKDAFVSTYYDEQKSTIGNGSQTSMSCALYFGLLNAEVSSTVVDNLVSSLDSDKLNMDVGVLGAKYLPNVLAENGKIKKAYDMINTTDFPGWGYWVSQGATTLWEDWEGQNSRNHIFFGDVSAWFYKYLAGIQLDESAPGYKHFFIEPFFPDDLSWVNASIDTYIGRITSNWEKDDEAIVMNVEIPYNSTATFIIPGNGKINVDRTSNGESETLVDLTVVQRSGESEFELGSGKYIITMPN